MCTDAGHLPYTLLIWIQSLASHMVPLHPPKAARLYKYIQIYKTKIKNKNGGGGVGWGKIKLNREPNRMISFTKTKISFLFAQHRYNLAIIVLENLREEPILLTQSQRALLMF